MLIYNYPKAIANFPKLFENVATKGTSTERPLEKQSVLVDVTFFKKKTEWRYRF